MSKTKKVDKVDLPASSFAYVGNPEDTSTWKLPIHFPGCEAKTVNHIKNALYRFDTAHGIPNDEYISTWFTLCGAAIAHGITVDRAKFAPKSHAPKPAPPPAQTPAEIEA